MNLKVWLKMHTELNDLTDKPQKLCHGWLNEISPHCHSTMLYDSTLFLAH